MQISEDKQVLSPKELAGYLGVSESKARRLLRSGEIKGFKIGTLSKVRRRDVDHYIRRKINDD